MICTGTFLAMGEIPIILLSMLLAQYIGLEYGLWVGMLSGILFVFIGITTFHRWYWAEWPFIRKRRVKEVLSGK